MTGYEIAIIIVAIGIFVKLLLDGFANLNNSGHKK